MRRVSHRGFTLVEVMLALAILFGALVMLMSKTASNIRASQQARMMGVTTDLARGKMYDLEEDLLHDGFQSTDQEESGDFSEQGWPKVTWEAKIEKVELPQLNTLEQLQNGEDGDGTGGSASGGGASGGSASGGGQPGGVLGGMLGLGGGGGAGGGGAGASAGGSLIASQFEMFSNVLEATIRKVTLTIRWKVAGDELSMDVITYFTDPAAVRKSMAGLPTGAAALTDPSGGGTGSTGTSTSGRPSTGGSSSSGGRAPSRGGRR